MKYKLMQRDEQNFEYEVFGVSESGDLNRLKRIAKQILKDNIENEYECENEMYIVDESNKVYSIYN